jgi:hypothetical protein
MEKIEYKKYTISIVQDSDSESPREWDNLGTMYCFHKRYNLGDKHNLSLEDAMNIEQSDQYITLPIYMYEHSGYTIATTPFSCRFDSGKLGIITVSLDKVRKEYSIKRISKQLRSLIVSYLNNEVKTYDQYLTGDVYGYEITDKHGCAIDSCYGFYGTESAIIEAKNMVDYYANKTPLQLELNL